ncbi:hypothetical protein AB0K80_17670 [Streptomyces sp. NPDC052682]|uniref:hypothetical protein n=1 Tax=Streptomyces sp. NPDC052682 TaxID=3154954 RepID=UPI003449FBBD
MSNRIRVATALATCGVVTAAVLYGDTPDTYAATSECTGVRPAHSMPLQRVLDHIDRLTATRRHSAVYTGLSLDEDKDVVDVWRIPSAAFDADVCDAVEKGVTVRLHDTDVNRRTLDALADRIGEDMHRFDATFELREVAVDERGWVSVGVDSLERAEPVLEKTFGAAHLKVEEVPQAELL